MIAGQQKKTIENEKWKTEKKDYEKRAKTNGKQMNASDSERREERTRRKRGLRFVLFII